MEAQNKVELETIIDNVIVYQNGVQIKEKGSVSLKNGEYNLLITDLPEALDEESVRVKGIGNGRIVNIIVDFNSRKKYKTEEHQKLNEQKEKLEREINLKEKKIERSNEQVNRYNNAEDTFYTLWAKAFAVGEVDLGNFSVFSENMDNTIDKKSDEIHHLQEEIKNLRAELQVVQNKINNLGPIEEIQNFYEITVNLQVAKEGEFKLEIRYNMVDAYWIPFYDVSLTESEATLTMMANVYNRTGFDWTDIDLEISTASLKPITLIKPQPTILREYVPMDYSKQRRDGPSRGFGGAGPPGAPAKPLMSLEKKMDEKEVYMEEAEAPMEEPEPELKPTYAEVSEAIGVQSFKIPNKVSIPSDKNPHPINLTTEKLNSIKKYYWSSAAPENVIIRDKLVNKDLVLLAGNVKIYYKEEFLGETDIPVIAPKEEFNLGTRVSYDLKITKKLVDRSKDKKTIKGKLVNNYEYKITIKNLNKVDEKVTIYDKIPHSSSENIKVELEEITPEPDKKQLGVLKWKIPLKDIEEKVIHYQYYVEYKKDVTITPPLP